MSENIKSIEECQKRLLSCLKKQQIVFCPIQNAGGLILAEDMISDMNLPPFPKSAMDGYAVRAEDISGADREHPVVLQVQAELLAGDYAEITYKEGTAVRVMTGSLIPEGYNAVVRQEDTDYGETEVTIYTSLKTYMNYCAIGEDLKAGDLVLQKNTRLNPAAIASLAGVGISEVPVYQPVRVSILSTGSELTDPGQELTPGHIYNSNAPMLRAAISAQQGMEVVFSGLVFDQEELLEANLKRAAEISDFLITTGGICVGKKDLLPQVLKKMGARVLFQGADIQPGTPTMACELEGKPVLCLSGNPYAALINFDLYFWDAVAFMTNCCEYRTEVRKVVFRGNYPKKNKHRRMIRGDLRGDEVYIPVKEHSASLIHNVIGCNCMIDLEAGRILQDGDAVTVRILK